MSKRYTRHIGRIAGTVLSACIILMSQGWMGPAALHAQNNVNGNGEGASVSISVSASVVSATEVSIVTLRDMSLEPQLTRQGVITIDPQEDAQAGQMRAEGEPNAEVRISFIEERELTRVGGPETLMFYYDVAGNDIDDQPSSEPLDLDNRDFTLNENGEFYFWVGGSVDIRNAVQGAYDGEFTIEIEYL